ncbi:MAG: serine/threonine protein kinase, partial [Myxococcales bacterium]|nr:serine/threonine protein kinase [Myxococcales bacterium]
MAAPANPLANVEKYRPIRELGRGGMGVVYLCEHALLGTKVVVKILLAELVHKSTLVDRMRLEAQALAQLRHPNLVRVTDFDTTPEGQPYFVMEYLPGTSLKDVVTERGGSLPVVEAVAYARQALEGLSFAHEQGLVHRDIKLDNLFLCDAVGEHGHRLVKILDFGVAKLLHGGENAPAPLANPTGTGMVVGTPRFFAPEQARGKKLDHRADLYSMGLCLYVMLAGRGPFDDCRTLIEVAKAHVGRVPEPPSKLARQPVPPELDALVLACLAKLPEGRPASARVVADTLGAIAARLTGPKHAGAPIESQKTEAISEELLAALKSTAHTAARRDAMPSRAQQPYGSQQGGAQQPYGSQQGGAQQPYGSQQGGAQQP